MANIDRIQLALSILKDWRAQGAEGFFIGRWYVDEPCGTTACAGGKLALDPRIQEMGLKLERTPHREHGHLLIYAVPGQLFKDYLRDYGFDALNSFFGFRAAEKVFKATKRAHGPQSEAKLRTLDDVISALEDTLPAKSVL